MGFLFFRDWIKYRRLSPRSVKRRLKKAERAIALKEWEKAENELRPLYENGLGGSDLSILYSQVLRGTQHFEEASRFIAYGLKQYPDDIRFHQEQGRLCLALGKPQEALSHMERCRNALRQEEEVYDLAFTYYSCGNYQEAIDLLAPYILSSEEEKVLSLCGDALKQKGCYQEAADLFEKVLQKKGSQPYLEKKLAVCYRQLGQLDKSTHLFRLVLEKEGEDLEGVLGLGACYQEEGYFLKALLLYQSHKEWKEANPALLKQGGICALHTKRFSLAEKCFFETLEKEGRSPELLSYFGYSLECQQKWEHAQEVYFEMIRLYPAFPHGWRALAWLYGVGFLTILTPKEGVAIAKKALELLPDALSWELLSACEARAGNFTLAHQIQEELLSLDKDPLSRTRRQEVLRTLRKHLPLEDHLLPRTLVA